jgi:hypothetical protein
MDLKWRDKVNRHLLILITLILHAWVIKANDVEKEEFLKKGFNWTHYETAQKLNLDLENYAIYVKNKSDKIRGTVMMGVGGGACGVGLYFFLCVALINSFEEDYERTNYYLGYDEYYDDDVDADDMIKAIFLLSGSMWMATGAGLIIGGAVKRRKIGKVFTKSGTRISLRPELDAINDRYGMRLSLSF